MHSAYLNHPADFKGWRKKARALLDDNIAPQQIVWMAQAETDDLFGSNSLCNDAVSGNIASVKEAPTSAYKNRRTSLEHAEPHTASLAEPFKVPREFLKLGEYVACHRDTDRYALLYRVLWRMKQGEKKLLQNPCDDDIHRLDRLSRAVARDRHKMTAFVRFRKLADANTEAHANNTEPPREHFISWFEPDHFILRLTSDFFMKRFPNMNWSIYTPEESAHWNGRALVFSEGSTKDNLPDAENMDDLWRTYFANIYNPARLRIKAMQSEMPVKYWKNLPEAPLIASLVHESDTRTSKMIEQPATRPSKFAAKAEYQEYSQRLTTEFKPSKNLSDLANNINRCCLCEHANIATQAVAGCIASLDVKLNAQHEPYKTAAAHAQLTADAVKQQNRMVMIVGEQPGDLEDIRGRPFVGPAGKLLLSILNELQLDLNGIYLTNAVKHFNYVPRGKRRIHQKPDDAAVKQCRGWLKDEVSLIKPSLIVALGRTAAKSLTGQAVKINEIRGQASFVFDDSGNAVPLLITAHPSSVLRASGGEAQERARQLLLHDLAQAFQVSDAVTAAQ